MQKPLTIFNTYKQLIEESSKEKPQLFIWPETCLPISLPDYFLRNIINFSKAPHIIGSIHTTGREHRKIYNSVKFYTYPYKQKDIYHKVHIVPYGEYIPFRSLISGSFRDMIERNSGMGKSLSRGENYKIFFFS